MGDYTQYELRKYIRQAAALIGPHVYN